VPAARLSGIELREYTARAPEGWAGSGVAGRGKEGQQALERGEVHALARRQMLDPTAEPAPAGFTSRAEVHDERAVRRERRSLFIVSCHRSSSSVDWRSFRRPSCDTE